MCLPRIKCVLNDAYIILVPSYDVAHFSEMCPVAFSNEFHIVKGTTHIRPRLPHQYAQRSPYHREAATSTIVQKSDVKSLM
jgi:hypothetical protein